MEQNIGKRECRLAAVLIAGLVVLLGYWFFFSSNGYCHNKKETAKMEYSEKQLLWRKSEKMTEQEMLKDMTLMANGDTVLVCWVVKSPFRLKWNRTHCTRLWESHRMRLSRSGRGNINRDLRSHR